MRVRVKVIGTISYKDVWLVLYPYRKLSLARSVDNQVITVQNEDHCTCNNGALSGWVV